MSSSADKKTRLKGKCTGSLPEINYEKTAKQEHWRHHHYCKKGFKNRVSRTWEFLCFGIIYRNLMNVNGNNCEDAEDNSVQIFKYILLKGYLVY